VGRERRGENERDRWVIRFQNTRRGGGGEGGSRRRRSCAAGRLLHLIKSRLSSRLRNSPFSPSQPSSPPSPPRTGCIRARLLRINSRNRSKIRRSYTFPIEFRALTATTRAILAGSEGDKVLIARASLGACDISLL